LVELLGSSPIFLSFVASCVSFQLRLLPSTGITRLRRYYKPLRHPSRPGLSLTSCRLIQNNDHRWDFSCCVWSPFACMPSPIPRQDRWKLVRSYDSINFGLPRNRGGSAPASTFSRPAQRSLALRPACSPSRLCDLLHQRLQQSRCLHCCSDCYRVE